MDQEIRKDLATTPSGSAGIRAAVIVPSVCDFYFSPHRFSTLGAKAVCNILSECGIKHVLFNFPLMNKKPQNIDIPDDISYVRDHIVQNETGKLSYFTKYQRFGPSCEDCASLVSNSSPTLCMISCFAFSYAQETIDLAEHIKKLRPELSIVVGGAGVSAYPLYFIRDTHIDFAISGEAEIGLKPFLKAMFEKALDFESVPNLFRNSDSQITRRKETPEPADPLNPDSGIRTLRYTSGNEIMPVIAKTLEKKDLISFSVSLTRGCERRCRFCSNFLCHGHGFRKASLESVAPLVNQLSIDQKKRLLVNFEDDNLLFASEYLLEVMHLFREKSGSVSFLAENGLDYNLLSPMLADRLIEAGMSKFNFTLGSIDETVLEGQDRKGSKTHFESIVRHIASRGLPVLSYFICGLKDDSQESVANVLAFLHNLPTLVGISMFYAIPGLLDFSDTAMFDKFCPHRCNGTSANPWYGKQGLQTNELLTAFRLSRYVNLLKSEIKSEIEMQLIEKIQKEKKLFTLVKQNKAVEIVPAPGTDNEMVGMVLDKIRS